MEELAPGIHCWTAPHPEWRPKAEEVVSYALVAGEALALVDPLLPAEDDARRAPLLADIDRMIGEAGRLELLITVPYHTRSAETLYERYSRTLPTLIWGHPGVKKRLTRLAPLEVVPQSAAGEAAVIADGAAMAYTVGKPRRSEYPLYFPGLRAVVFGDAVVGAEGGLRFWNHELGHRGGLVPRRVRAHPSRPRRAGHRVRAHHARAARARGRAASARRVPRRAARRDVLRAGRSAGRRPQATPGAPAHGQDRRRPRRRAGHPPAAPRPCRRPARCAAKRDRPPRCRASRRSASGRARARAARAAR